MRPSYFNLARHRTIILWLVVIFWLWIDVHTDFISFLSSFQNSEKWRAVNFSAISGVKQISSSNHSLQAECRRTWKTHIISHWDFSLLRLAGVLTVLLAHRRFKDCGELLKWFCMLWYALISDCSLCSSSLNVPKGLGFDLLSWCLTELGWGKLHLYARKKNTVRNQWGYNCQSCAEVISTFSEQVDPHLIWFLRKK